MRAGPTGSANEGVRPVQVGPLEVVIALDVQAPGAARAAVSQCLRGQIAASAVEDARLLVSELIANSVMHSNTPAGDQLTVSVELAADWFRIGVQDAGSGSAIGVRPPDLVNGGGFGLMLVEQLSDRWGVERLAGGGTRVWAQLPRVSGAIVGVA